MKALDHVAYMDSNHDSKVSWPEFKEFSKQMGKKRQNRRQKKTKQDQYDTAEYVFTFV